jgi:hypothetical protein
MTKGRLVYEKDFKNFRALFGYLIGVGVLSAFYTDGK